MTPLFKQREAKMGFGDNVPEQVIGRQPYRSPIKKAKSKSLSGAEGDN